MLSKRATLVLLGCGMLAGAAPALHAAELAPIERAYEEGDDGRLRRLVTEARVESPDDAAVLYWSGRVAMLDGDPDQAIEGFERARSLDPTNGTYHLWAGRAQVEKLQKSNIFAKRGYAAKAIERFEKAVEVAPQDAEARGALAQYYLRAPGFAGGDRKKGMEQLEVMRRLDPGGAAVALGWFHSSQKEYDEAMAQFERGITDAPADPRTHYNHALYCQSREQWSRAFAGFEKVQSMTQGAPVRRGRMLNEDALYQLGRTSAFSGERLDEGIAWLNDYIRRDILSGQPSKADAYWRLGMIYEHKRDRESARTSYRKALALEPGHDGAEKELKRID